MKIAFMYAGQGSQKVGMGKDLYENFPAFKNCYDSIEVKTDIKGLSFEGPIEELSKTENTQPCMSAYQAGVTDVLLENNIKPDVAFGLSLGEFGAFYAAGVYTASDFVKLTEFRGDAMMKSAAGVNCAMSAILGITSDVAEAGCANALDAGYVTVANYNCPGQYVICGELEAVEKAEGYLKENGAKRAVRLNVSGPFHTKFMEKASCDLKEYLSTMKLNAPAIPVIANTSAMAVSSVDEITAEIINQVKSSVRLEQTICNLIKDGVTDFIEIGPGNALSGFVKKCAKALEAEVNIYGIDDSASLEAVILKEELKCQK